MSYKKLSINYKDKPSVVIKSKSRNLLAELYGLDVDKVPDEVLTHPDALYTMVIAIIEYLDYLREARFI